MLFENISLLDENFDFQTNKWVGVKDGRIAYIGDAAPENAAEYGETYDGAGRLLSPAMYNLHSHVPMTLLRGYAENAPLQEWLNNLVWPFEAKMTADDNYWATALSCAELSRYGCVSFTDMYYHTRDRAKATNLFGMKANLSEGFLGFEPRPFEEYPVYGLTKELIAELHNTSNERIKMEYTIHAEYTFTEPVMAGVAKAAAEDGLPIHIHISETQSEHEECKGRHDGLTPIQLCDKLGVLEVPVIAGHCVWVEPKDIEIMAKRGVTAALNPASNMKLGSGFAPVPQLLEAGVNVALGTDGMASNNNHDMFQDMYLMALLSKGRYLDPTAVTPKQAIYAATRAGALAQGRPDCGLIKEGFKADLTVIDITGTSWTPLYNPLCNLVYAGHGSDVVLTMCDGRVVYRDGVWPGIDIEEIKSQVTERVFRIADEVKQG